jgi:hypothetical protein
MLNFSKHGYIFIFNDPIVQAHQQELINWDFRITVKRATE